MNCKDCEGHGWDEDTRGNMIVCKRCAGTGIALHPGDLAALAAANGYVKVDPPITSMHDPRLGIKKPEPWHIDVDALAKSAGYVKLEPGQCVVTMALVYAAKFRMDDEILQGMETNDEAYAEALDVIHRFERGAALDASGDKA
jgi:hypothetical protein